MKTSEPLLPVPSKKGWNNSVSQGFLERLELDGSSGNPNSELEAYRYEPARYIEEKLGWSPWRGEGEDRPGQREVLDAYELALRQLHEKAEWENGRKRTEELEYWQPGQIIKNRFRVEAGHTVGKTKLSSGLVNHFFDTCGPAIIYFFAPSHNQIKDLLWKEIRTDRDGKGLPGRCLDTCEIKYRPNHFAKGKATSDAGGKGTERIHGQHNKYLMFVLDEAEGIPDFVWNAVDSMASGGICIVLMLANPRTRSSKFHKAKDLSTVKSFRISCVHHPNVLAGKEVIPGAVRREYVQEMVEKHCEIADAHDPDQHTFTLPFEAQTANGLIPAGSILIPNSEFLFRVLGVAPANIADNTLIPVGRYEAACKRTEPKTTKDPRRARLGVDVARFGKDYGTLYIEHAGRVWRAAQFYKQDTGAYFDRIREELLDLHRERGVTDVQIRVDGGGGFGGGVIDQLLRDALLLRTFGGLADRVLEVHFNGTPSDEKAYYDLVTEMYAESGESLKGIQIVRAPETLEADLCERQYRWMNREGVSVKKLEPKDEFRKPTRVNRSPDDGDGFVLCVAPDHLFSSAPPPPAVGGAPSGIQTFRPGAAAAPAPSGGSFGTAASPLSIFSPR